jgi:hypothetical protein
VPAPRLAGGDGGRVAFEGGLDAPVGAVGDPAGDVVGASLGLAATTEEDTLDAARDHEVAADTVGHRRQTWHASQ